MKVALPTWIANRLGLSAPPTPPKSGGLRGTTSPSESGGLVGASSSSTPPRSGGPGGARGGLGFGLCLLLALLGSGGARWAQGQEPADPVPVEEAPAATPEGEVPAPPAGEAPVPEEGATTAIPLEPAAPAVPRVVGVVGLPELTLLLQRAGYDARLVTTEQVDTGSLDAYGLLLVNLEQPLTVTGAAFVRDFVGRGGRLIASSWGAAVAPRRQAAFPSYRLLEPLQMRVTGWSADGNAYLRGNDGSPLFRGLPAFLDVDYRATPLVEPLAGAKVAAVWVSQDPAGGAQDTRSPAILTAPRCIYFAPNVLTAAPRSRQMLRLLANAIGILLPAAGADPGRLPLAELEVTLAEAKRIAATSTDPEAATLLAAAEQKAAAAVQLASQVPAAPPAAAPNAAQVVPVIEAQGNGAPPAGALALTEPGSASPAISGVELAPAAPLPPLSADTLAVIREALDAAERVALLRFPCRTSEVRGVLLPRAALPASRTAIGQLLDRLAAAGVNAVFPEVYSAGLTLAAGPNQDPRFKGHDPLVSLLAEAPARGIAVYGWVSLLSGGAVGGKTGVLSAQPARAALTRKGSRLVAGGQHWICPSQPEAREAICAGIRKAAGDPGLQGILLSGVDYEGARDVCYCRTCVALFRADTGRNPQAEQLRGEWEREWLRWRRERVTTLVRRVQRDLRTQQPNRRIYISISAPTVDPRTDTVADWRAWTQAGWFNGVCIETHTAEPAQARKAAVRVSRLAPRIAVLPVVDTARIRTARHAMTMISALQEEGAAGVLFNAAGPVCNRWATDLARGSFRRAAALP